MTEAQHAATPDGPPGPARRLRYGAIPALRAAVFVLRRAWEWGRSWLVWLGTVSLLAAGLPAAQVAAVAWLVDAAQAGRPVGVPLLTLTALIALSQVAGDMVGVTQQRAVTHLDRQYQKALAFRVASTTPQQLATAETAARIEACRSTTRDLASLSGSVIAAVSAAVTGATLCASVWRFSPLAGLLVAAALVPVLVSYTRVARTYDANYLPFGEQTRHANYLIEQLIGQRSATELATLGSGHKIAGRAEHHLGLAAGLMDAILATLARSSAIGGIITAALLGGALTAIVANGGGSAGIAGGVLGVIAGLASIRSGGFAFGELIGTTPKVSAFRGLMLDLPQIPPQPAAGRASSIDLSHVGLTYPGATRPALTDVTLHAEAGTIIAFVGINGAGKTTAVNALLGIVDVTDGSVLIDGQDAATLPPEQRLSMFGLLTQEFGRYELTVRDTVALGAPGPVSDDDVWSALEAAHAASLVRDLPQGLDTQLGSQFGGVGLSGGQWQRLALARIYLRDAPVWLLDEPTSAIDAEAEQQVFAELQRRKAGRITVVVSHRAWTLKGMDRIYVFDRGRIVEQGAYDDLIAAGGRFSEIFAEQS